MYVLGISCFFHDSAACLLLNGKVIAAVQEERFTRNKHDNSFPVNAIEYCLAQGNEQLSALEAVVFYEKPFLKFERILETAFSNIPNGFAVFSKAIPQWTTEKLFMKSKLNKLLLQIDSNWDVQKLKFSQHHLSHAASAYYPSGFSQSAVLVVDGVGEWTTCSIWKAQGNALQLVSEKQYPHSLGLFYSAFTRYCGFKVNSGEYKLMGLAPYGQAKYAQLIKDTLINLKPDGDFTLNMRYFGFSQKMDSINKRFIALFGKPARLENQEISQYYKDIAKSVQTVLEEAMINLAKQAVKLTESNNLCLAGGVALNCVANQKIAETMPQTQIYIQPASGDAGCAAGAAMAYTYAAEPATPMYAWQHCYFGPAYSAQEVAAQLDTLNANYTYKTKTEIDEIVSIALSEGKIIGWFYGAAEFGPRALGNRSILANPMLPNMKKKLNLSIKYREGFRPFAPIVMQEFSSQYFKGNKPNPYMLFTQDVLVNTLPSITHLDNTARVQTVNEEQNLPIYQLLQAFNKRSNCATLINTSFNVRGEPPVLSPSHAYQCFMNTEMDILVIENYLLIKGNQPIQNKVHKQFKTD